MCDKMFSNESNHYGCTGCEICRIPQPDFACRIPDAGFRNSFCGISDAIHKRYSLPNLVWITGGAPNFTGIGRAVSKRQTTHGTRGRLYWASFFGRRNFLVHYRKIPGFGACRPQVHAKFCADPFNRSISTVREQLVVDLWSSVCRS